MSKKKIGWRIVFLLFLIIATINIVLQQRNTPYQHDEGQVFGTYYHITYQNDTSLNDDIMAELKKVDDALSMFNKNSIIARINRGENAETNNMFNRVFKLAEEISDNTDGAFDITVAPLVNAWGFGFKTGTPPTRHAIDSLRSAVGYKTVVLRDNRIFKQNPKTMLDFSAIAKGYGCDRVAEMLQQHGVKNLMVEIGGEIVVHGSNPQGQPWRMGVSKPIEDSLNVNNEIESVITFNDGALATSGNYRNFYYRDGKKYAHTIDPKTGHPVEHNLLSATVIAPDCATADAYATAFMVMGMEKAKKILERHQELKVLFIYTDDKGAMKLWKSVNTNTLTHGTGR